VSVNQHQFGCSACVLAHGRGFLGMFSVQQYANGFEEVVSRGAALAQQVSVIHPILVAR